MNGKEAGMVNTVTKVTARVRERKAVSLFVKVRGRDTYKRNPRLCQYHELDQNGEPLYCALMAHGPEVAHVLRLK
jgi:hypothetical protein